jgi:hypothetical protein
VPLKIGVSDLNLACRRRSSLRVVHGSVWHGGLLFTCPTTRMKVQQWENGDDDAPDNEFEAITCQACGRLHLLNPKTGKLLGAEEEE